MAAILNLKNNEMLGDILCCPLCKKSLIIDRLKFKCMYCSNEFSKEENVFNFRINNNTQNNSKTKILKNIDSNWSEQLIKNYLFDKYYYKIDDPNIKMIEDYLNHMKDTGINIGKRYDTEILPKGGLRDLHELLLSTAYIPKNISKKNAVDLGCGTLRATKKLLKLGFELIIAVDIIPDLMLYGYNTLTNEEKAKVLLISADVNFLPIQNESIDLVFSLELFEHIDVPELLFLETNRIMKVEGLAVYNTWNASSRGNKKNIKRKGKSYYENGFYYSFYRVHEIKRMLKKLNFEFIIKPYGSAVGRRILEKLSKKYSLILINYLSVLEKIFNRITPICLFSFIIIKFKKHNVRPNQNISQ